jgi:hypothetical protein
MKQNKILIFIFLLGIMFGCKKENPVEPVPIRTPDWVYGKITQPVPEWGSSTRLQLPALVGQIVFGPGAGIGGFGSHQGGHPEGLDHVWIDIIVGIPVRSWADGKVVKIENMQGEYFITIEYNGGLIGKHMEVQTPLVTVGQQVKAGDPVCYGLSYGTMQSAEFMLNDKNRNDGETAGSYGSYVSPFDYLRNDLKESLELAYTKNVIEPYLSVGKDAGNNHPVEPYLTNQLLFHKYHKNTIAGEWLLKSKWGAGGLPDIITLIDADNEYYKGKIIIAADNVGTGQHIFDGTWTVDNTTHQLTFTSNQVTYYGIYELNETGDRATLKIEYRTDKYPSSFSSATALYIERSNVPIIVDAGDLGVL